MKGRVLVDTKIKKMRERLTKHRLRMTEMEAQTVEMEQEIKRAEEEQLGYLARSAANNLTGGMDEIFELLRGLREREKLNTNKNLNESKEVENIDGSHKTGISNETNEANEASETNETEV